MSTAYLSKLLMILCPRLLLWFGVDIIGVVIHMLKRGDIVGSCLVPHLYIIRCMLIMLFRAILVYLLYPNLDHLGFLWRLEVVFFDMSQKELFGFKIAAFFCQIEGGFATVVFL